MSWQEIPYEKTVGPDKDEDITTAIGDKVDQEIDTSFPLECPEISEYAQVVFQNVAESYKPGKHVECHYTLTSVIKPYSRDWVAIFKVGWSSTRQYVAYDWSPFPKNFKEGCEHKQTVIFNAYYLPQQEDGEFYQFIYIDCYGKMRGASTPFQFLEYPMDDFVEIDDASMDILMITNKHTFAEENLERLLKEKDSLLNEKEEIEAEKQGLMEKVESLSEQLNGKQEELQQVAEELNNSKKTMEEEHTVRLESIRTEVEELKRERKRADESLKQMEDALLEMQKSMQSLEEERDRLRKELQEMTQEKDAFKGKFASSDSNNEVLRMEIDKLKKQLSELAEQQQAVRENEGILQEEKRKVEHQLLVASADKEHRCKLEAKMQQLEGFLASAKASNTKLKTEVQTLQTVHQKLSNDLEKACIERDSAMTWQKRQEADFRQKQLKAENYLRLCQHEASEKEGLLLDQVTALKDGMVNLVKEKEMALQKTDGSDAASQVAVQMFADKMKRAQQNLQEEQRKRMELEKKLASMQVSQSENSEDLENQVKYLSTRLEDESANHLQNVQDLTKNVEDFKARLNMAKDEFQKLYIIYKKEEEKNNKLVERKKESEFVLRTPAEPEIVRETEQTTQAALSRSFNDTVGEDSRDRTMNMEELATQLADLTVELEKRKKRALEYQKLYEEERMKRKQKDNLYKELQEVKRKKEVDFDLRYKQKKDELKNLHDKFNKLHQEHLRIKHINESLRFDKAEPKDKSDGKRSEPEYQRINSRVIRREPRQTVGAAPLPDQIVPRGPPQQYVNPYVEQMKKTENVCENAHGIKQESFEDVPSDLDKLCYPPQLTPPLEPIQTPTAKMVALKASLYKDAEKKGTPPQTPEIDDADMYSPDSGPTPPASADLSESDNIYGPPPVPNSPLPPAARNIERSASPAEFHDAVEFHDSNPKQCPECGISFPATFPDQEFAKHIQQHHAKQCPKCHNLLEIDISDIEYSRHLETCRETRRPIEADSPPKAYTGKCPVCDETLTFSSERDFITHVDEHF